MATQLSTPTPELAAYAASYPLEFQLHSILDDDIFPVLYIEAPGSGEILELNGENKGDKPLNYNAIGQVSLTNYHIQLRFRKNVIADGVTEKLKKATIPIEGWSYTFEQAQNGGKEDWLSLAKTDLTPLAKDSQFSLQVPGFNAMAQSGARNTRVEIRFANLQPEGAPASISGFLMRQLEIVSHLGRKHLPLKLEVEETNTVLNDGITGNLITLLLKNDHEENFEFGPNIILQLVFHDERTPSASEPQIGSVTFDWHPAMKPEGSQIWEYKFEAHTYEHLQGGSSKKIRIENWVDSRPDGTYHIRLRYFNIPGYWDGELSVPIELGPMVIKGQRVGIGTNAPDKKLHVVGDATITGYIDVLGIKVVQSSDLSLITPRIESLNNPEPLLDKLFLNYFSKKGVEVGGDLSISGNVKIGVTVEPPEPPKEKLHIEGNQLLNGQLLIGDPAKIAAAKKAFSDEYKEQSNEHAILFAGDHGNNDSAWIRFHSRSGQAHNLEIQVAQNGEDYLVLNPNGGSVGIGTGNPDSEKTLHIVGDTKIEGKLTVEDISFPVGPLSESGVKKNGEFIYPPDGSRDLSKWSIIISPTHTDLERTSYGGIIDYLPDFGRHIEALSDNSKFIITIISCAANDKGDHWQISSHYKFITSSGKIIDTETTDISLSNMPGPTVHYLIVRK